ncbi:MAG TPA: hypothetical protein VLC79_05365 [Cellvibrio sp.]|nr:hypothetical protein [Cellvibrio sp.]
MLKIVWKLMVFSLLLCGWCSVATAGVITCEPDNQRVATLSDAVECKTLNSVNLHSPAQIDGLYDDLGYPWVKEGELTGVGENNLFKVEADSWGVDVTGHWYIADAFWDSYSRAVITMHVGQGGGNPDAFAWLITPGTTYGDFSYTRISGTGGGLSNMFLFGSGTPLIRVSESGVLMLLLMGLFSLYAVRRYALV